MRQVHDGFLHRGLPLVLIRRVRSRAVIVRSAPMVGGVGAVISLTMMLAKLTDGDPDFQLRDPTGRADERALPLPTITVVVYFTAGLFAFFLALGIVAVLSGLRATVGGSGPSRP
jgi:hypothetical protein